MTLQQFKDKYLGKQVEYHSYSPLAKYQCVDLVNQYIVEVLGLTPVIGTDAKDFPSRFTTGEFAFIPNTPEGVPEEGDIVVWNGKVGGGAGHIAVFLEGNASKFTSLDQNWSQKQRVTTESHNYTNVSGWLRPKKDHMANELEVCMADRLKFWKERDEALAKLEAEIQEHKKTAVALDEARLEIEKLNNEQENQAPDMELWAINGLTIEVTEGNSKTISNYKLKN